MKKMNNLEKIQINLQYGFSYREFHGLFDGVPCQFLFLRQKKFQAKIQYTVSTKKMVNGQLYSRILNSLLEAVNLEPRFGFRPNLIMNGTKRKFLHPWGLRKVVISFDYATKISYYLLKFLTLPNWPNSMGNQLSKVCWINTKFGIEITNTCSDAIEEFEIFQFLSSSNQGVKESKI